ncbi:unnamed protein product [Bathycoccus prasinos]
MKRAMCNLKCYQKTGRVHRSKSADIIAQDDAECIVLQRYEDAPNRNFISGELNKFKALEDQDGKCFEKNEENGSTSSRGNSQKI